MQRTFVYALGFLKKWEKAGLNEDDLAQLEEAIMSNPNHAPLIEGTGGFRKLRWARPGLGKSAGVRVFFLDIELWQRTYMVAVISKNQESNLSKAERNELATMSHNMKETLERNNTKNS